MLWEARFIQELRRCNGTSLPDGLAFDTSKKFSMKMILNPFVLSLAGGEREVFCALSKINVQLKEKTSSIPTLVLTEHFLPERGGSIHWLIQTYSRYNPVETIFVAGQYDNDYGVGENLPFRVERAPLKMSDWDPTHPASFQRYLLSLLHVKKSCRRYGIQQVHCAKVLPEGLVAWWVRKLTAVPYLLYAHGEEILVSLTSRKLRWLIQRIYNEARAIIANSRHTKSLLESIGVCSEKIHVVYPGVDTTAFRVRDEVVEAVRRRHSLQGAPVLLTVGRLQRRKGQDMVIQALPRIAQKIPNVKYVIVGSGEEQTALVELARRYAVQDKVIFVGKVIDGELAAYFAACDVFIMPNRQIGPDIEGFGIVFLEAGAAGKPVIGGRSGGTGEAIIEGETGLRVDGENVEEIANAALSLLVDSIKAHCLGACGRRRVENEFSWERVVERTRTITNTLMQTG
jgi:phosphatidylinositol alpha-1,6-mannosyltransferase